MTDEAKVLTDDEVQRVWANNKIGELIISPEIDALCATVRALREKHTQLAEVSGEWARLLDRIRLWSKCADGYPLDEHVNNIATQLAKVTQERDERVHQAELAQERLQTAVQLALQGLHERCCEVAALQWFQHEYAHAVVKVKGADEATVFALRRGLPTLTGKQLP